MIVDEAQGRIDYHLTEISSTQSDTGCFRKKNWIARQRIGKTIIFIWLNCFKPKSIRSSLLSLIQNTKLRDTMESQLHLKCCGIFADGVNTIKVENKGYEKNLLKPCYHRVRRTVFNRKVRLNIIINCKFFRISSKEFNMKNVIIDDYFFSDINLTRLVAFEHLFLNVVSLR